MSENQKTKTCKHCKTEIPSGAKVCPNCRKKQGGVLKWVIIAIVAIGIIGAAAGSGSSDSDSGTKTAQSNKTSSDQESSSKSEKESKKEEEEESEAPIEYISVTATELSDALSNNAMKAQNDYKEKYLEITGKLGNIDSNGKYIGIDSDKDFDFTNIQCYIKSDEQKEVIMNKTTGDTIKVKGYCKDIGEIIGYSIDIESVE